MDLTDADEVARIHRKTWQKDFNDPDNYDVITHLDPDILGCEVKWALGSIMTKKSSGGDGIPAELFQILNRGWLFIALSSFTLITPKEVSVLEWGGLD